MKGSGRRYNPEAPTRAELDIMKEKAEALGRVGAKLEHCLRRLRDLAAHIRVLERDGQAAAETNVLIGEFNEVREKSLQYLHYLIIQREAMGFRRHTSVQRLYRIPDRKRPLPDGRRCTSGSSPITTWTG
jgi:hypothetical protein